MNRGIVKGTSFVKQRKRLGWVKLAARTLTFTMLAFGVGFAPVSAQQINRAPPKSVWDIDANGVATHVQSSLQCPVATGDFKRNQLILFDKVGFDVSCNYKNASTGDDVTIYLTRRDSSLLQKTFEEAKSAIVKLAPDATPRDTQLTSPAGSDWLQAEFLEKNRGTYSDLLLTSMSGWEFQIRATYNPGDTSNVTAAITDLSQKVMNSAGAHLAACTAVQPPVRTGKPARGEKLMPLLAISGAARALEVVPAADDGATWCAEFGMDIGKNSYLEWRNAATNAGIVERITNTDGAMLLALVSDPKGAEAAMKDAADVSLTSGVYVAVLNGKDAMSIYEIYAGYPPLEALANFLVGPHPVFASINKTDKRISIYAWAVQPPP